MDEARLRYRRTKEAKLDQRDRQRQWRLRRGAKKTVMDHGSAAVENAPLSSSRERTARRPFQWDAVIGALKNGLKHIFGVPYCVICGRAGKLVNPFHVGRSCYS